MKTRKETLLAICLCLISMTMKAQLDTVTVGTKVGSGELKALCYTFPQRVETFSMDDQGAYLCISFRETSKSGKWLKNKGEIGFYDMDKRELLWKSPINYATTHVTCLNKGVLVNKSYQTISMLNKEDGMKKWETKMYPIYTNDSLNLMLGYTTGSSNRLHAIELNYGIELWQQKLKHDCGWSRTARLDKDRLLIVADELHRLNLMTGELLTYPGSTGMLDKKAALLQGLVAVAGVAAGAAVSGGSMFYSYIPAAPNMITFLNSNILQHDSLYYWADRKQISCIDTTLNAVWQTPFPDVKAANSHLFIQNGKLYMLNYGYGHRSSGIRKKYGRPFIACYNMKDGTELFFNQLSMKKDMVEDALLTDDALYMLFDDGLAYQNLTDSVINITPWNVEQHGRLQAMLSDTVYFANEDRTVFQPLVFDGKHCLVRNDQGIIYEINKELNISNIYDSARIYIPQFRLKDYLCVGQGNEFWFIHKMGMPVARLHTDIKKGSVIGNKLLLLNNNNQLLFLDLDDAIR